MDGIANVARQQQSQISTPHTHERVVEHSTKAESTHTTPTKQPDPIKELQESGKISNDKNKKIESEKDVQDLVKDLNTALEPMNTSLQFGVDSQDVFYVSVIDTKTNKMIRRFPAEQAQAFLPKMQEVTGILFDSKG